MKHVFLSLLLVLSVQISSDNFQVVSNQIENTNYSVLIGDKNAFLDRNRNTISFQNKKTSKESVKTVDQLQNQTKKIANKAKKEYLELKKKQGTSVTPVDNFSKKAKQNENSLNLPTFEGNSVDNNSVIQHELPENPEESIDASTILPIEYSINIDFMSQAPHGNWQLPFKEACEEASVIMAAYYLNDKALNKDIMHSEILRTVAWQQKKFGYFEDTNMQETAQMMEVNFGFDSYLIDNPTQEQMQRLLSEGNLIIAPFAGRELGNPYFVPPGPPYHVILIHGYNEDSFLSHDPGTRRGGNYEYRFETIMNAMHDFNDGNINEGVARIVVITPEKI